MVVTYGTVDLNIEFLSSRHRRIGRGRAYEDVLRGARSDKGSENSGDLHSGRY